MEAHPDRAVVLLETGLSLAVTPVPRLNSTTGWTARATKPSSRVNLGLATVKSLQMEPVREERYGERRAVPRRGLRTRQLANTYNTVANVLEQAMTLGILVVGALLVIDSAALASSGAATFTIGMLVAFQMFASRLSQPMLRLVGLWQQFQQAEIAVRRLGDVMDVPAEPFSLIPQRAGDADGQSRAHRVPVGVVPLLRQVSLALPATSTSHQAQELTVLVGPTAAAAKARSPSCCSAFYPPTAAAS